MKNAKRYFSVFLILLLVAASLSLAGCGSGQAATPTPETAGIYTAGTYSATAQGMGEVTVSVTVDANAITSVELDLSNETADIGQAAADTLIEQVMAAQSAEIDGVSSATLTSDAVRAGVADCLAQAAAGSAAATPEPSGDEGDSESSEIRRFPSYAVDPESDDSAGQALAAYQAEMQLKYASEVRTLDNGVQVQRTPTDNTLHNTYTLKADDRGCAACHDDLGETLRTCRRVIWISAATVTLMLRCHRV